MRQTRLVSLIEATLNTVFGFILSFLIWPVAAWITGVEYDTAQHWGIVGIFTMFSIIRGYVIRRFFNNRLHSIAANMVGK